MTRAIRGFNKGRARVWWVHHGRDAMAAASLMAIVAIFLLVSHWDHQDALAAERAARAKLEAQFPTEQYGPPLPPTVFILEARDGAELDMRVAEIIGDLDPAGAAYVAVRASIALGPTHERVELADDLRERCRP